MKKLLLALLLILPLAACGSGVYKIPKQEYQTKVQVLGVLPILVDRASGADYPRRKRCLIWLKDRLWRKRSIWSTS